MQFRFGELFVKFNVLVERPDLDQAIVDFFKKNYKKPFDESVRFALRTRTAAAESATWALNVKGFEREIIGRLEQVKNDPYTTYYPIYKRIEEVQEAIAKDSVLFQFARIADSEEPDNQAFRYVLWAIPQSKPANRSLIQLIDLGSTTAIDQAVEAMYEVVSDRRSALDDCSNRLRTVYDLTLGKVSPALLSRKQWILSPTASLWLVPFAAMRDPENTANYVIENRQISYLVSGREVFATETHQPGKPGSVIVGDPAFGSLPPAFDTSLLSGRPRLWLADHPNSRLEEAEPVFLRFLFRRRQTCNQPGPVVPQEKGHMVLREFLVPAARQDGVFGGTRFSDDAGFKAMVDLLQRSLGTNENYVIKGTDASEAAMARRFRPLAKDNAQILALVTHGFYLPEPGSLTNLLPTPNPLKRCGLGWTGARRTLGVLNQKSGLNTPVEADEPGDGIMTAHEITKLGFRGVNLLILTACQGARGNIVSGDSLATTRHGFQLAGARFVLASTWDIPSPGEDEDHATAIFFKTFCKGLQANGSLKHLEERLRAAQKAVIAQKGPHPAFWASYSITGY